MALRLKITIHRALNPAHRYRPAVASESPARPSGASQRSLPAAGPFDRVTLARDLAALGLRPGDTLLIHASLRAVGWVCGGAADVVRALADAVGEAGTIVVPAQTPQNRDPSRWTDPAVPPQWWPALREGLPSFDPQVSPCREMGLVAETVRTWPGASRSRHPQVSFAGIGPRAAELLAVHDLDSQLGERSPLAALEAAGARTLLLGVGYDRCTAFHLAEYRVPDPPRREHACVIATESGPRWQRYLGHALDASDFGRLGADLEAQTSMVLRGRVGGAEARLLPIREVVAFAASWLPRNRRSHQRDAGALP